MAKNRSQKNSCITNITDLDGIATDDHDSPGPLTQLMDDYSLHYQRSHRPGPSDIHMDVDEDGGDPDETLDTVESTPTSKSGYRPSSLKAIEEIGDQSVTEGKAKRSIMDKKDLFFESHDDDAGPPKRKRKNFKNLLDENSVEDDGRKMSIIDSNMKTQKNIKLSKAIEGKTVSPGAGHSSGSEASSLVQPTDATYASSDDVDAKATGTARPRPNFAEESEVQDKSVLDFSVADVKEKVLPMFRNQELADQFEGKGKTPF